jgi:hypothetical protein
LKKLIYILLLLILISCGKSPLLNHQNESENPTGNTTSFISSMELNNLGHYLKLTWLKTPKGDPSIESEFLILVQNRLGELVDLESDAVFSVWGWMPSMGHGTADDGYTTRLSKGVYHHKELYFNMGGDWQLHFDIMKNGNLIDSTTTSLSL